jgi:hypothetical protein
MSKNAIAGAVTLCGVGLCMIGGALLMQNGQQAHAASGSMPAAAAAITAAALAQAGPTVVWYGVSSPSNYYGVTGPIVFRAWSDGTIEYKALQPTFQYSPCDPNYSMCISEWRVLSSPAQGYKTAADINADEKVDGADLGSVLGNWGDAPRVPFPPSDCPLNLINP